MRLLRNISRLLVLFVLLFVTSCDFASTDARLPNLEGMSREQITNKLDRLNIKYFFRFESREYHNSSEFDKFIRYGNDLKAGDIVPNGSTVYVYTTALNLPTSDIVKVEMDFDYHGKTLENDGIEKVTLARTVDGDTAHFYTQNNQYIKVRFLGINTPESTMNHDPWGKAASNFTSNILYNAKEIVIEMEGNSTDVYGRTLAFVWVDGELLNLKLVLNAYSNAKISSSSKYYDAFIETDYQVSLTGRRIWGEIDPNYDYEKGDFK